MNPEEIIALAEKYEQWATGWAGVNAPGPLEIPDCLAREYRAIAEGLRLLAGLPQSPADSVLVERQDLIEMLACWEECSQYKGEYLRNKHGDAEEIAQYRGRYLDQGPVSRQFGPQEKANEHSS